MYKLSRTILTVSLAVVLAVAFTTPTFAQQVFGSIFGTVTDASGAAVSNAKVTIADLSKGTSFQVNTDASGNYLKGQLIPGPYKVTIEAAGFQRVASNQIEVRVDEAARYDAALKVGEVTTEVEVVAAAPLLQSDRADIAQTFTSKEIGELPNIGRNVQAMTLLEPGSAKFGWQHAEQYSDGRGRAALLSDGLRAGWNNESGPNPWNHRYQSEHRLPRRNQAVTAELRRRVSYGGRRCCFLFHQVRNERISRQRV